MAETSITTTPPAPLKLPSFAVNDHLMPNVCLRSPLFGVLERRFSVPVKDLPVASINGTQITFTGMRLGQGDFEVFVQLVRLTAHRQDNTGLLRFSVREIIRVLGRSHGQRTRQSILDSITRLQGGQVRIIFFENDTRKYTYNGSFVDEFAYSHLEKTYKVRLNNNIAKLFNLGWSKIAWHKRLKLHSDLAKWLHGYLVSFGTSFLPTKIAKIQQLCGSDIGRFRDFRCRITFALGELHKHGIILSWNIDEKNIVHVNVAEQEEQIPDGQPVDQVLPSTEEKTDPIPIGHAQPPLLLIPLIKKDGEFPVHQTDIDQWQEAFPGIDVKQSLNRIRQWSIDNPHRRKTMNGIRRHISTWLGRDQDAIAGRILPVNSCQSASAAQEKQTADEYADREIRRTREYLESLYI